MLVNKYFVDRQTPITADWLNGVNAALQALPKDSNGNIGYKAPSGALRSISDKLGDTLSVEDYGAIGDGSSDDTVAFQAAINQAAISGNTVVIPAGLYKLTSTLTLPRNVSLQGVGYAFPVSAYNPTQQHTGVVLLKNHNSHCISVVGSGAYSESAGISNISIVSNVSTYPNGHGIFVDKVGSYVIENCNVWSCGGDGFHLGDTTGDVTGQLFVRNLYVNNCAGRAYYIRSKWLRAYNIISDGCTWGAYFQDAPEGYIDGFHFEGFSVGGIKLAGANTGSSFLKGFVSLTNPTATKGAELDSVAGNTSCTFDSVRFLGSATAGAFGMSIGASAWKTKISKCEFNSFPTGLIDAANYTFVEGSVFDVCALPITTTGSNSRLLGNTLITTSGSWSIDHQGGGSGVWANNFVDKPFKPTSSGVAGNFGTNLVYANKGFKTSASGTTSAIASGTAIPHGLGAIPVTITLQPLSGIYTNLGASTVDATNIVPSFSGGGSVQFMWTAQLNCERQT